MQKEIEVLGILSLNLGVGAILVGILGPSLYNRRVRSCKHWLETSGKIDNIQNDRERGMLATISYRDHDDTPRRSVVGAESGWHLGLEVPVFFDPKKPSQAATTRPTPMTTRQYCVFSCIACAIGIALIVVHARIR